MFTLEFFQLVKEFQQADKEGKYKIIKSLYLLAQQHREEFQNLIQKETSNSQVQLILKELENYESMSQKEEPIENQEDDILRIKKIFETWEKEFIKASDINEQCNKLVDDLLDFYMQNRYYVIKQLLDIDNGENYSHFKLHVKNSIRHRQIEKVEEYVKSENYKNLNFFSKLKKEREVRSLLKELVKYNFDFKKMEVVLQ